MLSLWRFQRILFVLQKCPCQISKDNYLSKEKIGRCNVVKQFIQEISRLVLEYSFLVLSIRILCFQLCVGIWRVHHLGHWCVVPTSSRSNNVSQRQVPPHPLGFMGIPKQITLVCAPVSYFSTWILSLISKIIKVKKTCIPTGNRNSEISFVCRGCPKCRSRNDTIHVFIDFLSPVCGK